VREKYFTSYFRVNLECRGKRQSKVAINKKRDRKGGGKKMKEKA